MTSILEVPHYNALTPSPTTVQPPQAESHRQPAGRPKHSLAELQRLAELLAVEDGYDPTVRDFVIPRNFKLSVVIPVYNEQATIQRLIAHVAALPIPKEIIVVDDGSTDGTRQILSEFECGHDVHVIVKPHNEGRGAALRTGLRRVSGDVVVIQYADLEHDPRNILPLIKPIVCGLADVVYGSRFLGSDSVSQSWLEHVGNRWLTTLSNWTTGLALTDVRSRLMAFRREVLQSFEIQESRGGCDAEIAARVARRKCRVYEVPVSHLPRETATGRWAACCDLAAELYCVVRYAPLASK